MVQSQVYIKSLENIRARLKLLPLQIQDLVFLRPGYLNDQGHMWATCRLLVDQNNAVFQFYYLLFI